MGALILLSCLVVNFVFSDKICRPRHFFIGKNLRRYVERYKLYGQPENTDNGPDNEISNEYGQEFFQSSDNANDLSAEEKEQILSLIEREGPSELEKRLRMMGFTPFTYAGFALAAVLISLNTILGTGWLGDLLGMNEDFSTTTTTTTTMRSTEEQPLLDIIEDQNMQFDYEKLREFQADQQSKP
jgi:hypothetical protein